MDLNLKPNRVAPAFTLSASAAAVLFCVSDSPWVAASPATYMVSLLWFFAAAALAVGAFDCVLAREHVEEAIAKLTDEYRLAVDKANALERELATEAIAEPLRALWHDKMIGTQKLALSHGERLSEAHRWKTSDPTRFILASNLALTLGVINVFWVFLFGPAVIINLAIHPNF